MSLESRSSSLGCIVPTHVLGPSDHAQAATDAGSEESVVETPPDSQEGTESASETPATPKAKAKAKAKGKNGNGKRKAESAEAGNKTKKTSSKTWSGMAPF